MANLNKVFLIGRLTADPETRQFASGKSTVTLSLAVNEKKRNAAGELQERTDYFYVRVFGKQADIAAKYLYKGREVCIEGHLQQETWQDKQTGQQRSRTDVITDNLQLIGSSSAPAQHQPQPRPQYTQPAAMPHEDEQDYPF